MIRFLRASAAWLFTGVFWAIVILVHVAAFKRLPATWLAGLIHFWGRAIFAILGIRVEFLNESTVSERAARVLIVNHQSALDLVWGAVICPPAPLAIGKREVIYIPVLNAIWWALDFIRIDRKNHVKALAALSGVSEKIARERRSLVIAPEGTRSPTGEILRFKKGAFHIARQAGVPICPVVVEGAYELLPKSSLLPRRGVIRLRFLPPVSTAGVSESGQDELMDRIRRDMIEAYEAMRRSRATS